MPLTRPSRSTKHVRSTLFALDPDRVSRWVNYPTSRTCLLTAPNNRPFLGLGSALTIAGSGLSRMTALRQSLDGLNFGAIDNRSSLDPPDGVRPRLVGACSFFPRRHLGEPWRDFDPAEFTLPRLQLLQGPDRVWVTVNQVDDRSPSPEPPELIRDLRQFDPAYENPGPNRATRGTLTPTNDEWLDRVRTQSKECRGDGLRKIVLAQRRRLQLDRPLSLRRFARDLTDYDSDTFGFLLRTGGQGVFLGSSPEQLVARHGRTIEAESLAGTTGSDRTAEARRDLAAELSRSEKDQHEHQHVVEYLRNRLSPLVTSLETMDQSVRTLPTLQHLLTGFRGKLHSDHHVLELVRDLHPTPAVAGRPSGEALARLRELETIDRGLYAGPIGWFDADGDGEFAVGIRSALVDGTTASLYAGAGIVPESVPEDELAELDLKFHSIRRFLLNQSS